jgi:hypothetical protein
MYFVQHTRLCLIVTRVPIQFTIITSSLHTIIHSTLVTGETEREEASGELDSNEERVEVDAKQHLI